MHSYAKLDHQYVWHPFTQMKDWLQREPVVIVSGKGAVLRDVNGKEYLDANSSIWTNLHGHRQATINAAIRRQLGKISHTSALGLANEPASLLARELVRLAKLPLPKEQPAPEDKKRPGSKQQSLARLHPELTKVFFSDDGSTAVEVSLKLAYELARRTGRAAQPRFVSMAGGYHGDTVGAMSLGHSELFHQNYSGLLFHSESIPSPYCYRCPHNRAKPERSDAREYRKCGWECVSAVERTFQRLRSKATPAAALVVEPLIQGAAGMIPQPKGWLRQVAELARAHNTPLIADEVMTGFGRTGTVFACHSEGVQPDLLALAKGLTGGYLPMAATLTTQAVFDVFLGEYGEFKTFFHGHSFTANQLGAAAALASLSLLQTTSSERARARLSRALSQELEVLWSLPNVGDIRQVGLVAGIELVRDWRTREPYPLVERAGLRVCERMASRGVLTRPIGNVIVLMPPYCTSEAQLHRMVAAVADSVREIL